MEDVDMVAITYDTNYTTLDGLRSGYCSSQIVCRLLRFWEAHNSHKEDESMGIVLLFLDEKDCVIQCFIPHILAKLMEDGLHEGRIYGIQGFDVSRSRELYKLTEHPFTIRFLPSTKINHLPHAQLPIEAHHFMLRKEDQLEALANTNLELPDVVGQIRYVQGSNLKDPTSTQRLVIRYMLNTSTIVYLTLWDDVAATFRSYLTSGDIAKNVMLVTTINPKMFEGKLYLNSTTGTRLYFDQTINAIKNITRSIIQSTNPFTKAETSTGIAKKELMSIGELINFMQKTNPQSQEGHFMCYATVVDVLNANKWYFMACPTCNATLKSYGPHSRCHRCYPSRHRCVARYRVEAYVEDGEESATFVIFDSEMTKLTHKTASTVMSSAGMQEVVPRCIKEIIGNTFLFEISITPTNVPAPPKTFIVSKMTPTRHISEVQRRSFEPTFTSLLHKTERVENPDDAD